jgi:hypothetical protein
MSKVGGLEGTAQFFDQFKHGPPTSSPPKQPIDTATPRAAPAARDNAFTCGCAARLDQVESAWRLVYERYVQKNLIDKNRFGIHTVPEAIGRHASVICESSGGEISTTMTLIGDNGAGIPLDSVYAQCLNALRGKGRSLVEVGLLAERRRRASRSAKTLFRMMRWAFYYTLHTQFTDIIIGVHPRHTPFYARCYGFENMAPPKCYPLVRGNPVVPMRLHLRERLSQNVLPRGLSHARDNPLPASVFSRRFCFHPEQLRGSRIEHFLGACAAT